MFMHVLDANRNSIQKQKIRQPGLVHKIYKSFTKFSRLYQYVVSDE